MRLPVDFMDRGAFPVPHIFYAPDVPLDKHERVFLSALVALEDRWFVDHQEGWFFATNAAIRACSGLSLRQIPRIRERLRQKRLIAYRRGHTGWATEYRILLDHFYRSEKEQIAQNRPTIKDK